MMDLEQPSVYTRVLDSIGTGGCFFLIVLGKDLQNYFSKDLLKSLCIISKDWFSQKAGLVFCM